ncbi:MAG: cyclic nucleotide-binding protein [Crocinitomicaceae bacterium]|nr:cyclic nucleotide-binding protein [Crocinitomicaceae bacterium]
MESFIQYLKSFTPLYADQIDALTALLTLEKLQPNEYLLEVGMYCNKIAFIQQGVFRIYFYNNEGEEITRYFLAENQFVVDLNAFNNQVVSSEYIQSVTDSEVVILSRTAFDQMSTIIPEWDKVIKAITEKALMEKLFNRSNMVGQSAKSKYLDFLTTHPKLANRIPLGHLASYLGIKQQSLSRIRKEIVLP